MDRTAGWSERKRAQFERDQAATRAFGWWRASPSDRWAPVDSPQGLKARGGRLVARCGSHDCSRRIRFDPGFWIARGMGDLQMTAIRAAYVCARTPCGLNWQNEIYPDGVPIIGYADDEGAEVVVTCRACAHRKTLKARRFVEWLIGRGRSPNVPAWDLHGTVKGPCPTCGERRWSVSLRVPGRIVEAPPRVA